MNVAIIPARRNSKSILNKNLMRVGKKSLVERAVESARNSGIFDKIILTTDIPALFEQFGSDKDISMRSRPSQLATDTASMLDVVRDALDYFGIPPSAIFWLLQPTTPFRSNFDYTIATRLLKEKDTNAVTSVVSVGANHPNRMYWIRRGILYELQYTNFKNKQDLPPAYIRSGHYYIGFVSRLREEKTFDPKFNRPLVMDYDLPFSLINIDGPNDLLFAQMLAEKHPNR